jgi:pimeloyl-ACP methyl ester carboxylesterase
MRLARRAVVGSSCPDRARQRITPEQQPNDVKSLLSALGGEPAHLFGSGGGAIAGLALVTAHTIASDPVDGLPAPAVDDLLERPTIRTFDNAQWPVGRIPHGQEVGEEPVAGEAQHVSGEILVRDGGVASAQSQVRCGDGDRHGRLAQVVLEQARTAGVLRLRGDDSYRGRGASNRSGAAPYTGPAIHRIGVEAVRGR